MKRKIGKGMETLQVSLIAHALFLCISSLLSWEFPSVFESSFALSFLLRTRNGEN